MKRIFAFVMIGMICLTACGSKGKAELPVGSKAETDLPADSKAETALPVYYSGSNTMDRRMPESYSDLMNYSDAVVIAEPTAEKEQLIEKTYNPIIGGEQATGGRTVVFFKVDQVVTGDIKEGDTLDINEYRYNWFHYTDDGTKSDCIISRSNAKPSVIGETYLLFLTKRSDEETWDFTFDEYGIYTYNDNTVGSWLRDDMDQESWDYTLYQKIFSEVTEQMAESGVLHSAYPAAG